MRNTLELYAYNIDQNGSKTAKTVVGWALRLKKVVGLDCNIFHNTCNIFHNTCNIFHKPICLCSISQTNCKQGPKSVYGCTLGCKIVFPSRTLKV